MTSPLIIAHLGQLIMSLGILKIALLTILLVLVFLFAWKAPNWAKETGTIALVLSIFFEFLQWIQTLGNLVMANGSISPVLVFLMLKTSLMIICYGLIIYVISLILRIINKPRI